jgi:hypothetical protein
MRFALKLALLVAIPCEIVVFGLYAYPFDTGYSSDDSLFYRVMSHFWLALHWPGVLSLAWLERRGASAFSELLVFVMSGYFSMVLFLFAAILAFRWMLRRMQTRTVARAH